MRILGLSALYHDSAAAFVEDGTIVAAAQEERFSRKKHDARFPYHAIEYCLREAGVNLPEIDRVVFYKKLDQKNLLTNALNELSPEFDCEEKLVFTEHHLALAASAFFPSPFDESAILTISGGENWTTTSAGMGSGNSLEILEEIHFPHSLGLLYSAATYYTGFKVNSGEYKVMGLAPYGTPKYAQRMLDHVIDLKPDGSFRLNQDYFDTCTGLAMTNDKFAVLFGEPRRTPDQPLKQFHMDMAASIQSVTEEAVLRLTRALAVKTGAQNLCLSGEVALNCVANGKVLRDGAFKNIWIQPAAGDAGGALGAALAGYHMFMSAPRKAHGTKDCMRGAYLGPAFAQEDIETRLKAAGAVFTVLSDEEILDTAVQALADGKAIGWMQGRMEFGPRALGARSILGDPRSEAMQKLLNLKVKYRESFRPFAPSVLREDVAEWFEMDGDSPYMLLVADVQAKHRRAMTEAENALFGIDKLNVPRSTIPAVTHVDYSARVQTVHADTNPKYHALISRFKEKTGCPVVVNTSFNVRGEPIVCSPEDAFRCFMGTEIEALIIGNAFLKKEDQDPALRRDYKNAFELD